MNTSLFCTALALVLSISHSHASDADKKVQKLKNYYEQLNKTKEDKGPSYTPEETSKKVVGKLVERFGGVGHYVAPASSESTKEEPSQDSHPPIPIDNRRDKGKEMESEKDPSLEEEGELYTQDSPLDDLFDLPPLKEDSLTASSTDQQLLSNESLEHIRRLGPKKVKQKEKPLKIDKLIKLKGVDDKVAHKIKTDIARQKGNYPVAHVPTMDYFDFLKISELHSMGLEGEMIKVGVVDSWFDYEAKNLKKVITRSTRNLAPLKGTEGFANNKTKFNVGFSPDKGEFSVTGHHGNHVASVIHSIAPESSLKYVNFQAEQGIGGKDFIHYCKAIDRAIESRVDFLNFSLLFPGDALGEPMAEMIRDKLIEAANHGIGLVIALGNDDKSSLEDNYVKDLIDLSQSKEMKGRMILVGATQYTDGQERKASFSNYPAGVLDARKVIFAPGADIRAFGGGGYKVVKSGTSQATPIVTGVAVLIKELLVKKELKSLYGVKRKYSSNEIKAAKKRITPDKVFSILLRSTRKETFTGSMILDNKFGRGILNPTGAVVFATKQYEREKRDAIQLRPWAQKFKKRLESLKEASPEEEAESKDDLQKYPSDEGPSQPQDLRETSTDVVLHQAKIPPFHKGGARQKKILKEIGRFGPIDRSDLPSPHLFEPEVSEEEFLFNKS